MNDCANNVGRFFFPEYQEVDLAYKRLMGIWKQRWNLNHWDLKVIKKNPNK